jgi:uracil-DNA glycosylase
MASLSCSSSRAALASSATLRRSSSMRATAWSGEPLFEASETARWLMLGEAPGRRAAISA